MVHHQRHIVQVRRCWPDWMIGEWYRSLHLTHLHLVASWTVMEYSKSWAAKMSPIRTQIKRAIAFAFMLFRVSSVTYSVECSFSRQKTDCWEHLWLKHLYLFFCDGFYHMKQICCSWTPVILMTLSVITQELSTDVPGGWDILLFYLKTMKHIYFTKRLTIYPPFCLWLL